MPTLAQAMSSGPEPDHWIIIEQVGDLTLIHNEVTFQWKIHDASGPGSGTVEVVRNFNKDELMIIEYRQRKRLDNIVARLDALENT